MLKDFGNHIIGTNESLIKRHFIKMSFLFGINNTINSNYDNINSGF